MTVGQLRDVRDRDGHTCGRSGGGPQSRPNEGEPNGRTTIARVDCARHVRGDHARHWPGAVAGPATTRAAARTPAPTDRSGKPKTGGVLRYGVEAETSGLNPTTDRFAASAYLMGNAVFDRLAYLDDKGEYRPYLAQSITPNADKTVWTVKLRPGIKFHDGTPLTSEALKTTFELALSDPLVGLAVRPLFRPQNQVEIVDDLTARYYMAEPNAHFPLYSASQVGFIASPTWLRAGGGEPRSQPAARRHGPVQVQEPHPGLHHVVRAQRRLVGRQGLPRRYRFRRADRRRAARRPAARRRHRRHAHERSVRDRAAARRSPT